MRGCWRNCMRPLQAELRPLRCRPRRSAAHDGRRAEIGETATDAAVQHAEL